MALTSLVARAVYVSLLANGGEPRPRGHVLEERRFYRRANLDLTQCGIPYLVYT
jgi:hypothetical protein